MWFLWHGFTLQSALARIFASVFIVFLVLPLHEYAHGWVALKLGDPTAKLYGRLTFNPLESFDVLGSIGLLLFGFGWAKPVPVDPRYFKNPRRDMALVSVAGPLSNIFAAIISGFMLSFVSACGANGIVTAFFKYMVTINISVAVFNLFPLPSLDGFKILEAFLPDSALEKFYQNRALIMLIMMFLLLLGAFDGIFYFLERILGVLIFNMTNIF